MVRYNLQYRYESADSIEGFFNWYDRLDLLEKYKNKLSLVDHYLILTTDNFSDLQDFIGLAEEVIFHKEDSKKHPFDYQIIFNDDPSW